MNVPPELTISFLLGIEPSVISAILQPLDTASSRMQTSEFGKSKGLWETLSEGSWSEAYDGLAISILLTTNPSIQVSLFEYFYQ
jgi:hypothetical protein